MGLGEARDLLGPDGGDLRQIAGGRVERQGVERDLVEPGREPFDGLEAVGKDSQQVASGFVELSRAHRLLANPPQFAENLLCRAPHGFGRHRRRNQERATGPAIDEAARGAISEAVALAQVEVDPTGELAPQKCVQDPQADPVGMTARHAEMSHPELGLLRTGAVDDHHPKGRSRGRRRSGRSRIVDDERSCSES